MMLEQRIKQTEIAEAELVVVTAKLTDSGRAKPYETFSMCMSSGYASPIAYFATLAEALAAHDQLVAHVRADPRQYYRPAELTAIIDDLDDEVFKINPLTGRRALPAQTRRSAAIADAADRSARIMTSAELLQWLGLK
jgi:hypothetical protein